MRAFHLVSLFFLVCLLASATHFYYESQRENITQAKRFTSEMDLRKVLVLEPNQMQVAFQPHIDRPKYQCFHREDHSSEGFALRIRSERAYNSQIHITASTIDGQAYNELLVTHHQETQGIGSKVTNRAFLDQFMGKVATENYAKRWRLQQDGGDIDAVSGATISSRAVVNTLYRGLITTSELHTANEQSVGPQND